MSAIAQQDLDNGGAASVPQLLAQVYETAPAPERSRLLTQLLRPLSLLSLVAVADGVFARIGLRGGWPALTVGLDELPAVGGAQVMALAEFVQQVSIESVDDLAGLLMASPVLGGSAAAALLATLLVQRAARRRGRL